MFKKFFGEGRVRTSITGMLQKRNRIRIISLSVCFLMGAGAFFQLIINNPKPGRAYTYNFDPILNIFTINDSRDHIKIEDSIFYSSPAGSLTPAPLDITGFHVIIDGDSNNNGGCDSADENEYTFYGTNHFKSLTVRNCAIIQHAALTQGVDFDIVTSALTPAGELKKIDIMVDEDLILMSGGSINVSGKGYPGGALNTCSSNGGGQSIQDGFGPGRGLAHRRDGGCCSQAGGGGFGGNGYLGLAPSGGAIYTDINPPRQLSLGSGGGSSYQHDYEGGIGGSKNNWGCSNGGAGGGRVTLVADKFSTPSPTSGIYANGFSQYSIGGDHPQDAVGGGGSGGSIWIEAKSFAPPTFGGENLVAMPGNLPHVSGAGIISTDGINGFNIQANGGNGSGGGGGRITLVKKSGVEMTTIRKEIVPITSGINPYSLKKGDRILVNLYVAGMKLNEPVTIRDELPLYSSGGCTSVISYPGVDGEVSGNSVVWADYIPATRDTAYLNPSEFSYECTIQ